MLTKEIGSVIRQLREERGMSLEEVGQKLNLSKKQISRYELGETHLNIGRIYDFAKLYSVSPKLLLGLEFCSEIEILFNSLSDEKQNQVISFIKFLKSDG
jgi:transcriptional regulator with XRE-family HTH domain